MLITEADFDIGLGVCERESGKRKERKSRWGKEEAEGFSRGLGHIKKYNVRSNIWSNLIFATLCAILPSPVLKM